MAPVRLPEPTSTHCPGYLLASIAIVRLPISSYCRTARWVEASQPAAGRHLAPFDHETAQVPRAVVSHQFDAADVVDHRLDAVIEVGAAALLILYGPPTQLVRMENRREHHKALHRGLRSDEADFVSQAAAHHSGSCCFLPANCGRFRTLRSRADSSRITRCSSEGEGRGTAYSWVQHVVDQFASHQRRCSRCLVRTGVISICRKCSMSAGPR